MNTLPRRTFLLAVPLAACTRRVDGPRCAHCGMRADAAPPFRCGAETTDGPLLFDAPRCLFAYRAAHPGALRGLWVVEYYGGGRIAADQVHYVVGSSRIGPMGHDLIPVAPAEAGRFAHDHGGRVVEFAAIDAAVLRSLDP